MYISVVDVLYCVYVTDVFFCKQKTAYEMRISDWSSDVCSSDLSGQGAGQVHAFTRAAPRPLFWKEGVWRPGWTARQCTKLHDGAESTLTAPQAPGVNRTSGAGRTPQARVQAATPASAAWRSAW